MERPEDIKELMTALDGMASIENLERGHKLISEAFYKLELGGSRMGVQISPDDDKDHFYVIAVEEVDKEKFKELDDHFNDREGDRIDE